MRILAALLPLAIAGCEAEQPKAAGHGSNHAAASAPTEAARAYDSAMDRMHRDMGKASADSDESFMRMMIAHHQGAIEMAQIELRHGRDAQARRLAERVVAAQTAEIREIEAWLAKRQAAIGRTR
jgi:uncharacterized protein (DUF305 family)